MKPIKIGDGCYLVDWRYKDFLRIGHEFQGAVIVKLERRENFGADYVMVTVENVKYQI